jgi:hypothetical protein
MAFTIESMVKEISCLARLAANVLVWDNEANFALPTPTSTSSGASLLAFATSFGILLSPPEGGGLDLQPIKVNARHNVRRTTIVFFMISTPHNSKLSDKSAEVNSWH